jgi:hypothetical protein
VVVAVLLLSVRMNLPLSVAARKEEEQLSTSAILHLEQEQASVLSTKASVEWTYYKYERFSDLQCGLAA